MRRNGRVTFSQRTTFAHWLMRIGRSRQDCTHFAYIRADHGLRRGPDGERLLQLLAAADRHPGALRREALDVLLLLLQEALGDEEREVGVDVAGLLDAPVHVRLHVLPDARSRRAG